MHLSAHPAPAGPTAPASGSASLTPTGPGEWTLGGAWTAQGLGAMADDRALPGERPGPEAASRPAPTLLDGAALAALDSAGAWVLQRWLQRGLARRSATDEAHRSGPTLRDWPERALGLMREVQKAGAAPLALAPRPNLPQRTGRSVVAGGRQAMAFLAFVGQVAVAAADVVRHPRRFRLRAVLHEIEIGGFDALPIIGLTAFLLGVVVAYQGADQLRHYGANVFVVELVGYAMLREFAPLIGAIIIAGRSGSAHAAQIGTMVVTEEIDAMRTIGIDPMQRLVLPKVIALAIALPLLTVFADIAGVAGGMVMARSQLNIGFGEFAERFGRVMQGSALLLGLGKSFVFSFIIVLIGCFQGFRTEGSADSVGRQTTLSVVQAIFLVIVADAVFSVAFNVLGL
jgi:phospholipid/cholesterol/gamma-HCH transport system permease protein